MVSKRQWEQRLRDFDQSDMSAYRYAALKGISRTSSTGFGLNPPEINLEHDFLRLAVLSYSS